jgi:hypothetical protein
MWERQGMAKHKRKKKSHGLKGPSCKFGVNKHTGNCLKHKRKHR